MSVTNPDRFVTKQDLADFYHGIYPFLGNAEAGFTPIGTVIAVMGNTAPANYLACDGTVYNISSYLELATYFEQQFGSKNYFGGNGTTTFAVPDLRGEFLRGTGTNGHSGQGSGANVGVHQNATKQNLLARNETAIVSQKVKSGANNWAENMDATFNDNQEVGYVWWNYTGGDSTNNYVTMFASRPTNTSVLYCIATKNIYLNPSDDYSASEKVVGTYIDGKPVYQKTLTGATFQTLPASRGTLNFYANGFSDIDKVVSVDGFLNLIISDVHTQYYTGEIVQIRPLSFWDTADADLFCSTRINRQGKSVSVEGMMSTRWFAISPTITLRYTKTTD